MMDVAADEFLSTVGASVGNNFQRLAVFPGDNVTNSVVAATSSVRLGRGLVQHGKFVSTTALGTLHYKEPSFYWVEQAGKRYTPQTGDNVVGLVEDKMGEFYAINVFSGHTCIMNRLAFDGATKRNKPELKRGDVVYARVQSSGRDCDTELSCLVTSGAKKDWSTGEATYGELPSGLLVRVSPAFARRLLQPDNVLLAALSKTLCYEVAIGMNGAVWLRASGNRAVDMVVIRNALLSAETLDAAQTVALVEELVKLSKQVHVPSS